EHVATHVAYAYHRKRLVLYVYAQLAEVPFYPFPSALASNAHAFMVITHRTPGGKGIGQPEAAIQRNTVGDIREAGRALVGGHHQVRIVLIAAYHVFRIDDPVLI